MGPERVSDTGENPVIRRVPRNAPALWNLGHKDIDVVMHDGRISVDDIYGNGFNTPAEEWLPMGLETILAAQAMFPVTSKIEMAGNSGENEVVGARFDRIDNVWPILAKRVRTIPAYGEAFVSAYPHVTTPEEVTMVEVANAISAFIIQDFTSFDSPFDAYLAGDQTALSDIQKDGMELFFGKAGCSGCHSGNLFSDQGFHALGLPAFGPGRTRKFDLINRDVGRMGESDSLADAYRFRTPMLRNVALSGPYGHNGAYPTLERMVRHHMNPAEARDSWHRSDLTLPDVAWFRAADFMIQSDRFEMARQAFVLDIAIKQADESDIQALVACLHALTGDAAAAQAAHVPETVPSGLPVDHVRK